MDAVHLLYGDAMPASRRPGRPPAASRRMLQEAALDLFAERGYERVAVDEIARVCGVGRSTFFNYFRTKADVFWVEIDEALDMLDRAVGASVDAGAVTDASALQGVLAGVAGEFGPDRVPWVLTQGELIGDPETLAASAAARVARLADLLGRALRPGRAVFAARVTAAALAGAIVAGMLAWADAGIGRGALAPFLDAAGGSVRLPPAE